jgi:hypothetical protein
VFSIADDPTRDSVRLALVLYAFCVGLMPWLDEAGWQARTGLGRLVRLAWALACLIFLAHVALAFHHHHGWSHARAMEHVAERGGFGPGIFLSYLFTLAWVVDAAWWWLLPIRYARRPGWVGASLHGFMLFMVFNATVVFEIGPARWSGLMLLALLGLSLVLRFRPRLAPGGTP